MDKKQLEERIKELENQLGIRSPILLKVFGNPKKIVGSKNMFSGRGSWHNEFGK